MATSIPEIDFSPCRIDRSPLLEDKEKVGDKLVDALANAGFAYLLNTGINWEWIDKVNQVTAQFFQCTEVEKKAYAKQPFNFGYFGVGGEDLNPNRKDYKEYFSFSGNILRHDSDVKWPDDLSPDFSKVTKKFMGMCRDLSIRILATLGVGMGLKDGDHFAKCHSMIHTDGNQTTMRSLYYPPSPNHLQPGDVRLGEHSDYGSITLLFQDNTGGLQVQNLEGSYIDVTPRNDAVVINIGDVLQFWTRGRMRSTKHRVLVPEEAKRCVIRRSLGYFVHPNNDTRIDEELVFGNERKISIVSGFNETIRPITVKEYLQERRTATVKSY